MRRYSEQITVQGQPMTIWSIDNNVNGNPRYVVHFLSLSDNYEEAVSIIKNIGGRVYSAKWFGGGLVFSSYSVESDLERALEGGTK